MFYKRQFEKEVSDALASGNSIFLLGPRQTGKTTFAKSLPHDLYVSLMEPDVFYRYNKDPALFSKEVRALGKTLGKAPTVILDEAQHIPNITDACQVMIDEKEAVFFITSSSARKIRNLLPGRVFLYKLSTLMLSEYEENRSLESILNNGFLPGICQRHHQKEIDKILNTYVSTYLEEEIRKEALVRQLSGFVNFLQLACIDSGNPININATSQRLGIPHHTISEYYRILEDCLLVRRVEPIRISNQSKRRLTKTARFMFFDLGLRRVAAKEGINPSLSQKGRLLEQFVGIELFTHIESKDLPITIKFWRDHNGPEVDYILEQEGLYTPIEVKLTTHPQKKDLKHLKVFRSEYPIKDHCYLIANVPTPYEIEKGIIVLPWNQIHTLFRNT